jgi:peptidoglycan/xylan/chitin deacetylase (PgdA/CDA1 family)
MKAAALLYHDVVLDGRYETSGFQGAGPDRYKLDAAEFDEHLQALATRLGNSPVTVGELGQSDSRLPWLLTFDDGGASARLIGEKLAERGWCGHFFVTVDFIGTRSFITATDIRTLENEGHVIGSHSCSHPDRMSHCSWGKLQDEWRRSTSVLSDIVGHQVSVASIPGGNYSKTVARAASSAGIDQLFTSEPVLTVKEVDGCSVFGRLSIVRHVPAERAAELASGRAGPRLRLFTSWQAKKAVKNVGGESYLKFRRFVLERRR